MPDMLHLLAQILGPVAIVKSLALLANPSRLKTIIHAIATNEGLQFIIDIIKLLLGITLIRVVPLIPESGYVLIHILGWIIIVMSTTGLLFPELTTSLLHKIAKNIYHMTIALIISLLIGIAISYRGYIM